jgi:hypothetical protein
MLFVEEYKVDVVIMVRYHAMKTYGDGGIAPPFLTSALDGGE